MKPAHLRFEVETIGPRGSKLLSTDCQVSSMYSVAELVRHKSVSSGILREEATFDAIITIVNA